MKLLLITPLFPSKVHPAVGKDRESLVKHLVKKGVTTSVVTLRRPGETSLEEDEASIYTIYRVPANTIPQIEYPLPYLPGLVELIRKIGGDFDIHHYYQQEYLTIIPSIFHAECAKLVTIDNFPGLDWYYGNSIIDTIARFYSITLGSYALTRFDGLIFLNKTSMEIARKLGLAQKDSEWIPHGVDTKETHPDPSMGKRIRSELGIDTPIVAFVGRLSSVKGITYLAEAIMQLNTERFEAQFIIIGEGPERSKLDALKSNVSARVQLLGYQSDPIKFIQASDFLVLPSLGEGCPNVILETFACGKPVIGSKVGGIPDLIQNGINGILVEPKNSIQLAKAIRDMVSNPEKVKAMGQRAREFAEKELDWNIVIKRILQFYSRFSEL